MWRLALRAYGHPHTAAPSGQPLRPILGLNLTRSLHPFTGNRAMASPPLDPLHGLHLENGRFSGTTDTKAGDVDRLLAEFESQRARWASGLVVHFHGGLVSHEAGKKVARDLQDDYEAALAYPVFFVWESGLLDNVRNNLGDIAKEKLFRELAGKVLKFAIGKIGGAAGGKGAAGPLPDDHVARQAVDGWLSGGATPVLLKAPILGAAKSGKGAATSSDQALKQEIQANLEADFTFRTVLEGLVQPAVGARGAGGAGPRKATVTRMDPTELGEFVDQPIPGGRVGAIALAKAAVAITGLVIAVVKRFLDHRDHGLRATIVEEILRRYYVADVVKVALWNQMKNDTEDAFAASVTPGTEPGGTIFLQKLAVKLAGGMSPPTVTLVGHSTGAIYICNFLEAAATHVPNLRFRIILLAPACTVKLCKATFEKHAARVAGVRMFGMKDDTELKDAIAGPVYPHSLLYFVSGLLENDADEPLLGMQRFFNLTKVFPGSELTWARDFFLKAPASRATWSVANNGAGRDSTAERHGDFDNDPQTLASLQHLITSGF